MTKGRLLACSLLGAALWLATPAARAGDPVAAEALFRAGRDAVERGDYTTACARFAESHKLDPAAGTALNLGDCSEHLGKLATAWQRYQEAADRFGADDRGDLARKKVAELSARLARVTITLAKDAPKGSVVARDGVEIGAAALGVAMPIDAGDHRFTVRAPGHAERDLPLHIEDGESRTLECAPGPEAPSGDEAPRSSVAFPLGIALGSLGALGIGAGAVTGVLTMDRRDAVRANCDADKACNPAGIAAASEGKTFSAISTAAFIGGGVALATGVTLVILGRPNKTPAVQATAGPRGAGLVLTGHF